jgi:hypothetical protein
MHGDPRVNTDTQTLTPVLELQEQRTHQPPAVRPEYAAVATPMAVLERAYANGASVETMAQLLQLKREWDKDEASKAFTEAMTLFKQNPPEIIKDKFVGYENKDKTKTGYYHATLAAVCAAAIKGLADVGISHSWSVDQTSGQIAVTCVLTHKLGHSERVTIAAGADTSGKKNSIQAINSTITYLQRYTLLSITGLATKDQDDDGAGHQEPMPDWVDIYLNAINTAPSKEDLSAAWKTAVRACIDAKDTAAHDELRSAMMARGEALGLTPAAAKA